MKVINKFHRNHRKINRTHWEIIGKSQKERSKFIEKLQENITKITGKLQKNKITRSKFIEKLQENITKITGKRQKNKITAKSHHNDPKNQR